MIMDKGAEGVVVENAYLKSYLETALESVEALAGEGRTINNG